MSAHLSPYPPAGRLRNFWQNSPQDVVHWIRTRCAHVADADLAAKRLFRYATYGKSLECGHRVQSAFFEDFDLNHNVKIDAVSYAQGDGSVKFMCALVDGKQVETVLIPERGRLTLCVSSQVGCAQGCRFCATGRMGLLRSLSVSEIIGQLKVANGFLETFEHREALQNFCGHSSVTNVVFMGMGEPLDNVEAVVAAAQLMMHPWAFGLSPQRVTVSTVGLHPQLGVFLSQSRASLALSVHTPFFEERARIVPAEKEHPLQKTIDLLHTQPRGPRFFVFAQVTLLRGVNDSVEHAEELAKIFRGISVKFNLIPLNEHEGAAFRRPDLQAVVTFAQVLRQRGYVTTVRLSKGRDVHAACGQLAIFSKNQA